MDKAIHSLGDFCESVGGNAMQAIDLMKVLQDRQVFQTAKNEALMNRFRGNPRPFAKPLMEDGHEFARHEARIPLPVAMHLMQQKNFGYEGLMSDEGMKDLLRAFPQCRVQMTSGKIVGVGFGPGRQRKVVKRYNEPVTA